MAFEKIFLTVDPFGKGLRRIIFPYGFRGVTFRSRNRQQLKSNWEILLVDNEWNWKQIWKMPLQLNLNSWNRRTTATNWRNKLKLKNNWEVIINLN